MIKKQKAMREIRIVINCDEGFVADTLRDLATAYEDDMDERDWLEVEHGCGSLEFVEVPDPKPSQDDIVGGIFAKRKSIDDEIQDKEAKRDAYIEELEAKVKELAPRLRKMFDVAEALTANRFYLGPIKDGWQTMESPKFCTEHITHRVGFFCNHPYLEAPARNFTMTGYFGIANGGACGDQDLKVDRDGNVQRYDFSPRYRDYKKTYIEDLECLLKKFDEVEQGLFEYAKNPISR